MAELSEYSDTLRALGRFLESVGASEIAVSDEGAHLAVSWRGKGGARLEREYSAFEVQSLRISARLFRGLEEGRPRFAMPELLRTLGRQLDEREARGISLVETNEGFWISANVEGERVGQLFTFTDLIAQARAYHRSRLSPEVAQQG